MHMIYESGSNASLETVTNIAHQYASNRCATLDAVALNSLVSYRWFPDARTYFPTRKSYASLFPLFISLLELLSFILLVVDVCVNSTIISLLILTGRHTL
jgi:hypothetical protein